MRAEPKPNARRLKCIQCGERKPRTSPKATQIPNHTTLLQLDPFCSATCARAYHGAELNVVQFGPKIRSENFKGVAA